MCQETYTKMFVSLFIMDQNLKLPINSKMDKLLHVHTRTVNPNYNYARMDLIRKSFSRRSQTQKNIYYVICLFKVQK